MGRTAAVTYEQAAEAAEQLQAEGLTPTAKLIRSTLGAGSLATLQRYITEWREKPERAQPVTRILSPDIQRVVFKFIDQEVARANCELIQEVEQARRDMDDLAADNDEQANLVRQLQAALAEQATLMARQEGHLARLLEELSSAREETLVERRGRERLQIELGKLESRLESHASHEGELQRLRADFEAQRQACVHAEQSAAVLKAQKEILEARVAELKKAASPHTRIHGDGSDDDGHAGVASEDTPRTSSRRARNAKGAGTPPDQDSAHPSGPASSVPVQPDDSRQSRLC